MISTQSDLQEGTKLAKKFLTLMGSSYQKLFVMRRIIISDYFSGAMNSIKTKKTCQMMSHKGHKVNIQKLLVYKGYSRIIFKQVTGI